MRNSVGGGAEPLQSHLGGIGLVRDQFLKPLVLLLEVLQPLGLADVQTAVFLTPTVVGLLGDTYLAGSLADGFTRGNENLGFT